MPVASEKPIVLVTGAAGNIGAALSAGLGDAYRVVGFDRPGTWAGFPLIKVDLTSEEALSRGLETFRRCFGARIASVVHLAAYFDFTGEDHPLYGKLNVDATRRLLRALQVFEVEQFVYSGTMLVHAPCRPGERIDETRPIAPKWAYPRSKAKAEDVVRQEHGRIPYVLLRLAGVYDEHTAVPTLARQIARIYERDLQSHLYSGDPLVGQSMLHKMDMIDAFRRTIDRRAALPRELTVLVGEPEAVGYDAIQDELGRLIHREREWTTLEVPKGIAKLGAWAQEKLEPVVPDAIDQGEKPFIRPFMVDMADDHYALDIGRATSLLGWRPARHLLGELPKMVAALKDDPPGWYEANGIPAPPWLRAADEAGADVEEVRVRHRRHYDREHARNR